LRMTWAGGLLDAAVAMSSRASSTGHMCSRYQPPAASHQAWQESINTWGSWLKLWLAGLSPHLFCSSQCSCNSLG
jgi:hypothetical protein